MYLCTYVLIVNIYFHYLRIKIEQYIYGYDYGYNYNYGFTGYDLIELLVIDDSFDLNCVYIFRQVGRQVRGRCKWWQPGRCDTWPLGGRAFRGQLKAWQPKGWRQPGYLDRMDRIEWIGQNGQDRMDRIEQAVAYTVAYWLLRFLNRQVVDIRSLALPGFASLMCLETSGISQVTVSVTVQAIAQVEETA